MKDSLETSKCLASLAVFRELYNSEKDIYGIICEFLKEIIFSNGKHQFTLTEIAQLLNETYDFEIPEAVVKTSLNRFKDSLAKSQGLYTVTNQSAFTVSGELTGSYISIQHANELIIQNLVTFIEYAQRVRLSEEEKVNIIHAFCSFMLDESTAIKYSEYVSAFILKGREDHAFTSAAL